MPKPPFDLNTYEGVVADIVSKLDDEGRALLRKTPKDDLIQFHFGWGRNIRNEYHLWSNEALVKSCAKHAGQEGFIHPDDASSIIMKGVWEVANSRP